MDLTHSFCWLEIAASIPGMRCTKTNDLQQTVDCEPFMIRLVWMIVLHVRYCLDVHFKVGLGEMRKELMHDT